MSEKTMSTFELWIDSYMHWIQLIAACGYIS